MQIGSGFAFIAVAAIGLPALGATFSAPDEMFTPEAAKRLTVSNNAAMSVAYGAVEATTPTTALYGPGLVSVRMGVQPGETAPIMIEPEVALSPCGPVCDVVEAGLSAGAQTAPAVFTNLFPAAAFPVEDGEAAE